MVGSDGVPGAVKISELAAEDVFARSAVQHMIMSHAQLSLDNTLVQRLDPAARRRQRVDRPPRTKIVNFAFDQASWRAGIYHSQKFDRLAGLLQLQRHLEHDDPAKADAKQA